MNLDSIDNANVSSFYPMAVSCSQVRSVSDPVMSFSEVALYKLSLQLRVSNLLGNVSSSCFKWDCGSLRSH